MHKAIVAVGLWLACKAVEMYKVIISQQPVAHPAQANQQYPAPAPACPPRHTCSAAPLPTAVSPVVPTHPQEYDKTQRKELVELALQCRRMATHRALLQQRAIRA